MARESIDPEGDDWEPLLGERPSSRLTLHPCCDFVAMQASVWIETTVERAVLP
jgi:hypothetical protein